MLVFTIFQKIDLDCFVLYDCKEQNRKGFTSMIFYSVCVNFFSVHSISTNNNTDLLLLEQYSIIINTELLIEKHFYKND